MWKLNNFNEFWQCMQQVVGSFLSPLSLSMLNFFFFSLGVIEIGMDFGWGRKFIFFFSFQMNEK